MEGVFGRRSESAKWLLLGAITISLLVAALGAAEFAVRIRQSLKYGTAKTVDQLYRVDEKINLRVPLAKLDTGRIQTNALGFRGPEITVPKPPEVIRIAFLGASTTWCGEVSGNGKAWPHLVTEGLRERFPHVGFDYVNGGVPGYTVSSSLRNLEYRIAPLEPDVIVIYHATNDMSGDLRELAVRQGLIRDARMDPESWLSRNSLLWDLAQKNFRVLMAQNDAKRQVGRLQVDPTALGEAFRRNLTSLARASREQAQMVAIATFSIHLRADQNLDAQLRASASALYYMPFMAPDGLIAAYARYNEIIRDVAASEGAVLIGGEHAIPGTPEYFSDTVHFTDAGSQAMAQRVMSVLAGPVSSIVPGAK